MGLQKPTGLMDLFLLQNIFSTEGRCETYPIGVQLFLLETNFGKNGHPGIVILPEFFAQNVLSPEGRGVAYPIGVQLFLLVLYLGRKCL